MALDETIHRLFIPCRKPPRMQVINTDSGGIATWAATIGDADDVFVDEARRFVYVIGGDGLVDVVFVRAAEALVSRLRVPTGPGARTGLYVPEWNQVLVAVPRSQGKEARILVFSTLPDLSRPGPDLGPDPDPPAAIQSVGPGFAADSGARPSRCDSIESVQGPAREVAAARKETSMANSLLPLEERNLTPDQVEALDKRRDLAHVPRHCRAVFGHRRGPAPLGRPGSDLFARLGSPHGVLLRVGMRNRLRLGPPGLIMRRGTPRLD